MNTKVLDQTIIETAHNCELVITKFLVNNEEEYNIHIRKKGSTTFLHNIANISERDIKKMLTPYVPMPNIFAL